MIAASCASSQGVPAIVEPVTCPSPSIVIKYDRQLLFAIRAHLSTIRALCVMAVLYYTGASHEGVVVAD